MSFLLAPDCVVNGAPGPTVSVVPSPGLLSAPGLGLFLAGLLLGALAMVSGWLFWQRRKGSVHASEVDFSRALRGEPSPAVDPQEAVALIAHELRNPLNPVIGMGEVISETAREEHIRKLGQNILESGKDLKKLIDSMLDYTRVQQGKIELRPRSVNLYRLLEGLIEIHRKEAEHRGLTLRLVVQDTLPEKIRTDPERLRQVVSNLLTNALKYTNTGGISVEARAGTRPASQPGFGPGTPFWLSITVSDTGIGIPEDDAERLLEPFYRSDEARRSGVEGTGLGLAICNEIIKAMQGILTLAPGESGGTVARVQLPVLASPRLRSERSGDNPERQH
ncbi:MAG: sensor histidine kinase [Opitutales bacterium]